MLKIYFKQAIEMLMQNKFISMIAIIGTALAIMMIMALIVSDNIRTISVAPEINRDRTFYIPIQMEEDTVGKSWRSGSLNYAIYKEYLSGLQVPQYISVRNHGSILISRIGNDDMLNVKNQLTDDDYWKIFSFRFKEGGAWSKEDVQSGLKNVIITESIARRLFKSEKALGESIMIGFEPYRITGIVEDISPVFTMAHSDIWIPYTSIAEYEKKGVGMVLLPAKDKKDLPEIDREIRNAESRYDAKEKNNILRFRGPENHNVIIKASGNRNEDIKKMMTSLQRKSIFIFMVLLLVPAINLSGLSLSRMKKRTEEIGVRKAFGAKRHVILIQVLYENLITSLLGGIIGLILSYVVIYHMKHWLLGIPQDSNIPLTTLVSWPVLLSVVVICIILNLLSAGIPAYRASRMNIVNSLNQNDK